ncbi:hypothetical protein MTO96_026360 [Rhipicephalus appendiculatus]
MTKECTADAPAPQHPCGPQQQSKEKPVLVVVFALAVALLAALVVAMISLKLITGKKQMKRRPHIVFILADDLGWADVSYAGVAQIRTPNIDALAWNGIRLSRVYHQPLCTPTRSSIMSGLYPIHTGLQHFVLVNEEPRGLPLELKILPQWLNDMGYTSYMVGKWHLGFCKVSYTPTKRGFVSHVGNFGGALDYFNHTRVSVSACQH